MADGDNGNEAGSDSEWEYEYSKEESEDFYIILDFPIPVEPETGNSVTNRSVIKFSGNEATPEHEPDGSPATGLIPDQGSTSANVPKHEVQITDLATRHPLLAYKQKIYSCGWATTVGTNMLFYRPTERDRDLQLAEPPSRLIATTRTRLVATPTEVKPKSPDLSAASKSTKSTSSAPENNDTPRAKQQRQANFLEKLQAAKRKRGERDMVPTEPVLTLNRPVDWIDQAKHEQARKEHEDRRPKNRRPRATSETPRPRKSRKTTTEADTEGASPASRPGSSNRRRGRPAGRKSSRIVRDMLGLYTHGEPNAQARIGSGGTNGEPNDSTSISMPTPARFEFVESAEGQLVATVPQESPRDVEMDDRDSPGINSVEGPE